MPTTRSHIVIEARQLTSGTWQYRVVTPGLDWQTAQAEWDRLDNLRPINAHLRASVHYMVRDDADPTWSHLARPQVFMPTAKNSGGNPAQRAARAYGAANGVVGGKGGWLYDITRRVADGGKRKGVCQGWAAYASIALRRGDIAPVPGTYTRGDSPGTMRWQASWVAMPAWGSDSRSRATVAS